MSDILERLKKLDKWLRKFDVPTRMKKELRSIIEELEEEEG